MKYPELNIAIHHAGVRLIDSGKPLLTQRWQGMSTNQDKSFTLFEALNINIEVPLTENHEELVLLVKPNLPWAENHFMERVGGLPLNPGLQYKKWPFYKMDEKVRVENGQFSHSYMERFWPKFAGKFQDEHLLTKGDPTEYGISKNRGVRYEVGDYRDVVNLLYREPDTRQAFLPIWFPEDTGNKHKGRVPCSLGYLFIIRDGKLNVTYYMRSCDYLRHFRDDVYHAVRLAQHTLGILRKMSSSFEYVTLGYLNMNIANLHIFQNEVELLKKTLSKFNQVK